MATQQVPAAGRGKILKTRSVLLICLTWLFSFGAVNANPAVDTAANATSNMVVSAYDGKKLLGIDRNEDGIRDEVAHYISTTYIEHPRQKVFATAYHKGLMEILSADISTPVPAELSQRIFTAKKCLFFSFQTVEQSNISTGELFNLTLNTKDRLEHFVWRTSKPSGIRYNLSLEDCNSIQ